MTTEEAGTILREGLERIATERTEFLNRLDQDYAQLILENVRLVVTDVVDARFASVGISGNGIQKSVALAWVADPSVITDGELHEAMEIRRRAQSQA